MKNSFFLSIVIGILVMGCTSSNEYRIEGNVAGMKSGIIRLITYSNDEADTIASGEVINGKFELRGACPEITPVLLTLSDHNLGGVPVYLENKHYKINVDQNYIYLSEISGGGEAQRISDVYRDFDIRQFKAIDKVREEFIRLKPEDARYQELSVFLDSLGEVTESVKEKFLLKHADSYLAMELLAKNTKRLNLEGLREKYNTFSPKMQNSFSGRNVAAWIQKMEETGIGQLAQDFTVQTPSGKSFNLYSVKAKVKLIDFWASWCAPCRGMIPEMKQLYEDFHERGLEIVSISMDNRKEYWLKALEDEKMPWIQGSDLKGNAPETPIVKAYGLQGVPYLILLDENNRVIAREAGGDKVPVIREVLSRIWGK